MSYARSPKEDEFVKSYLAREIHALGVNADIQKQFIEFAVTTGDADARKLPPRLYHVIKGRTPSAYLAILIHRFFDERQYEKFVRTKKDYVEYITDSGDIVDLEHLVSRHPLSLRIVRIKMTSWAMTGKPERIYIHLRSPISNIDAENVEGDIVENFNKRLAEFREWMGSQPDIPTSYRLNSGELIELQYEPDWLRYSDEDGFEGLSELAGHLDITWGVNILLYAALGEKFHNLPTGLDTFYELVNLFEGRGTDSAPKELTFSNYWPRVVQGEADIAEIFFRHIEEFPSNVRSTLSNFFKSFAGNHQDWVSKAFADDAILKEQDESYIPNPEDVFHYNHVKKTFSNELKPVLKSCWNDFTNAALAILEIERQKARKHFAKMKKVFG